MDRLQDPPTLLKVATTQEIDLQPWAPRQWTSTTTRWRWRCGFILLPSLTLRSPHLQGGYWTQEYQIHNKATIHVLYVILSIPWLLIPSDLTSQGISRLCIDQIRHNIPSLASEKLTPSMLTAQVINFTPMLSDKITGDIISITTLDVYISYDIINEITS